MHKRVEVIWKEVIPRDRTLSERVLVVGEMAVIDSDDVITVRPLLLVE